MGEWREITSAEEGRSAVVEIIENETYTAVLLVWPYPSPGTSFIDEAQSCSERQPWRAGIYINIAGDEDIPQKLKKDYYAVGNDKCAAMLNRTILFLRRYRSHKNSFSISRPIDLICSRF